MGTVEERIRRIAAGLFEQKKIDVLVGFEAGSAGYRSRPSFIRSAADAARLAWDATCSQNLAVYLTELFRRDPKAKHAPPPRAAFVAKACDMRSIIALVKEKQAPRENLVLIGVPCRGMIDERKLAAEAGRRSSRAEVTALVDGEDTVSVTCADGISMSLSREPLVQDACRDCRFPSPQAADVTVDGPSRAPSTSGDAAAQERSRLPAGERWDAFASEISRCIRCYACRQACPTCYCTECFAETNSPAWVGATTELTDTMIFHIIRIFHQAGRCVECGACVRACPMGIDLGPLTKKVAADVRAMFGFTPDFNAETPPPLVTFKDDDGQAFISEPGRG